MGITPLGVLYVVALLSAIAVMAHFTHKKAIDEPLAEGRARGSAVAEFADDLLQHRWVVIVGLALLVAIDKSYRFSDGWLESKVVMSALIAGIFVVRLVLRRNRRARVG